MKAVSSDILIIAAAQGSGTSILIILFVLTVRADAPKYYMGMTNGITGILGHCIHPFTRNLIPQPHLLLHKPHK